MIRTFKDKEARRIWEDQKRSRKLPAGIQAKALEKPRMLDSVERLNDLRIPPSNRLEALKGDRAGQYSIRINDQWLICFEWIGNNAENVEIVDYH